MGDIGLENRRIPKGNAAIPNAVARKIAHFDLEMLWKSLQDSERALVILFVAKLTGTKIEAAKD